jgi:hypothetical protein
MRALILTGSIRVFQIEEDGNIFPVHSNLQWINCPNTVTTGHTYVDGQFVDPVEWSAEYQWKELRLRRSALLTKSDWTQNADVSVDVDAWKTYRQELRDLPANTADPAHPSWPVKPE